MCGVAGEQGPPGPVVVRHSLADAKPGSQTSVTFTAASRGLCVSLQALRTDDVRLLRRIFDFRHEPERPVRERRHDRHAG